MIRILLIGLCTVAVANAAETPEAWIEKLSAAYAKHSGFVATYHSEGEGKSLEATLALDETSGIALSGADVTKDDGNFHMRQWLTDNEFFFDRNGQRAKASSPLTELKSLATLLERSVTVPVDTQDLLSSHFTPQFLLTRDSVEQTLLATPLDQPAWFKKVAGASVSEITETAVTFETQTYGLLTISREHGLLLSQFLTGAEDEERVLTLTKLELDPTVDQIKEVSRDWSTLGATPIPAGSLTADSRHRVFQMMVEAIERGATDRAKLTAALREKRDLLRRLAASSITDNFPLAQLDLKEPVAKAREQIRSKWLESLAEGEAADEPAFEAFLGRAEVRERLLAALMAKVIRTMRDERDPEKTATIMPEFFGPDPDHVLRSNGDAGKEAKWLIEAALALACIEAHIDRRLASAWGDHHDLD